ncbi:MAG: HD domain-containing protein [Nitrospirae bacterium]|nr:HD domain-containing protein [Nitrospirota bacterium]
MTKNYFRIDKELTIVLLLVAITGFIFFFVSNQRAFLNFFYLPVLLSAYYYGKRYATQSALFSAILIFIIACLYPLTFYYQTSELSRWLDILTWGGFLLITGYSMGLLYERKEQTIGELRKTYRGIIEMLSLVIDSVDRETQSHSYRVSVISEMIASEMGCSEVEIENIRTAALLHDIGKIGISSEILHKIGKLSGDERQRMKNHTRLGTDVLKPVGGRVLELLPIILHHHEKYDGSGYNAMVEESIPVGARIIAVADVYDALISDRPYRKALPPFEAKKDIMTNAGTQFDPKVVKAFDSVFSKLDDMLGPVFPSKHLADR